MIIGRSNGAFAFRIWRVGTFVIPLLFLDVGESVKVERFDGGWRYDVRQLDEQL
jgi:hypothetical protein